MIDTLRSEWPSGMIHAADFPEMGMMEHVARDAVEQLADCARQNPLAFGLCAFGIGFVVGWKLKPW